MKAIAFFLYRYFCLALVLSAFVLNLPAQELKRGYFPSGKLRYEGRFLNGQPAGKVTHYYENGKTRAIMVHNGRETDAVLYGEQDSSYSVSGKYLDRKKNGEWLYRKEGRLLLKEEYAGGILDGNTTRYYKDGGVAEMKHWDAGILLGEWKLFYDNGNLHLQAFYKNGKLEGKTKAYNYDGILTAEGDYQNNLKDGTWRFYDKAGKLLKERTFKQGLCEDEEEDTEGRQIDALVNIGSKIPDPADFRDDPDAYLKLVEE